MSRAQLLLVSPEFHGYWQSIAEAFERRGYDVRTHVYDRHGTFASLRWKTTRDLPTKLGLHVGPDRQETKAAVSALKASHADIVLVLKGDTLGEPFWQELSTHPRRALWLYDELRRTRHTAQTLEAAGSIVSYSRADAAALRAGSHTAMHVPNAYDPHIPVTPKSNDAVVFVGARYPNREQLLRTLASHGVPVHAYGRDWSDHPIDRIRTLRLGTVGIPNSRELARDLAYNVMSGARATLNTHWNQDGFTMRTFEAAGIGAVQLIDRADVAEYFEPDTEIGVFSTPQEAVDLALRATRDHRWARRIREGGHRRAVADHTFDHRVAAIERLWE